MWEALSAIRTPTVAVSTPRRLVGEASAYVGAAVTNLSPGGTARFARQPKNEAAEAALCKVCVFMGVSPPHCQFQVGNFRERAIKKPLRPTLAQAPWSSDGPPSAARTRPWRLAPFRPSRAAKACSRYPGAPFRGRETAASP